MMHEETKIPAAQTAQRGSDAEILQDYTRSFWRNSKFWMWCVLAVIILVFALVFKKAVMDTSIDPGQLKASLEFFDISSQWVVKENISEIDFQGIVLVPEVSFRIRNIGPKDLSYVYLLGVFRFMDNGKFIGEGYRMALRKALPPAGESERITLKSGFGYRASSADAFEKHKKNWQNARCDLYVKSHNSGLVSVKTFYISRRISGQGIEVQIN
jgi:hypothetical protein